jgi:hypothetical protein
MGHPKFIFARATRPDVGGGGVDGDYDGAVRVGGAAGIGVVGEEILGAEFAVDAVKDGAEFSRRYHN